MYCSIIASRHVCADPVEGDGGGGGDGGEPAGGDESYWNILLEADMSHIEFGDKIRKQINIL